jgi:hypothetical protein
VWGLFDPGTPLWLGEDGFGVAGRDGWRGAGVGDAWRGAGGGDDGRGAGGGDDGRGAGGGDDGRGAGGGDDGRGAGGGDDWRGGGGGGDDGRGAVVLLSANRANPVTRMIRLERSQPARTVFRRIILLPSISAERDELPRSGYTTLWTKKDCSGPTAFRRPGRSIVRLPATPTGRTAPKSPTCSLIHVHWTVSHLHKRNSNRSCAK